MTQDVHLVELNPALFKFCTCLPPRTPPTPTPPVLQRIHFLVAAIELCSGSLGKLGSVPVVTGCKAGIHSGHFTSESCPPQLLGIVLILCEKEV